MSKKLLQFAHLFVYTDIMVLTESTWKYFSQIPFRVRSALAHSKSSVPFEYDSEFQIIYLKRWQNKWYEL